MVPLERLDALDRSIEDRTLVRGRWAFTDSDGRQRVCLLATLSPEVLDGRTALSCPAEIMPLWLAILTPWLDDYPSADMWQLLMRRYAACARRWHVLGEEEWEYVNRRMRTIAHTIIKTLEEKIQEAEWHSSVA